MASLKEVAARLRDGEELTFDLFVEVLSDNPPRWDNPVEGISIEQADALARVVNLMDDLRTEAFVHRLHDHDADCPFVNMHTGADGLPTATDLYMMLATMLEVYIEKRATPQEATKLRAIAGLEV